MSQVGRPSARDELADLRLPQPGLDQRRAHAALPRPPSCPAGDRRGRPCWRRRRARGRPRRAAIGASRVNSSSLQKKQRLAPLRAYSGFASSSRPHDHVAQADAARRGAAPPPARAAGYVSESAVTSSARSPSASSAARASKVESTPPEKATTTRVQLAQERDEPRVLGVERPSRRAHPSSGPASAASGVIGRAPTCEMTSAAASAPSRPQVGEAAGRGSART